MKTEHPISYICIDEYSSTPKYLQLSNSILNAVQTGRLKKEQLMPSINELSLELEISRDTVEKGYRYLKQLGVLASVPGKGYYIVNDNFKQKLKIFLLFNKLSFHKKLIYDAFVKALGDHVAVDLYIYNNDFLLFKRFLNNTHGDYSHYVIIPHFIEGGEKAYEIINAIPKEKLVIVDKKISGVDGEYAAVYENFEKDIYDALYKAREQLAKYQTLKIIFPEKSYFPEEILRGFTRFCTENGFVYKVVYTISDEKISRGDVYINLMEDDLVTLIENILTHDFIVGKDVGVISYNETPLKKIILKGITTISTDFAKMGEMAAKMILDQSNEHLEVPFYLTLRPSL